MALHRTAGFAVGRQAAKGTKATTLAIVRATRSQATTQHDQTDNTGEMAGVHQRPTAVQAPAIRTGVMGVWSVQGRIYPDAIGHLLAAAGFAVTTQVDTPEVGVNTHTFTLATGDALPWVTVARLLGEGANRAGFALVDGRAVNLSLNADRNGLSMQAEGRALSVEETTGAETLVPETVVPLSQAKGSFTLTSSVVTGVGAVRTNQLTIANPVDEEEQNQHNFHRADLPPTGINITGVLGGILWDQDTEKELLFGGATVQDEIAIPEAALTWEWTSADNIAGQTVPYKLAVSIAKAQLVMQPFEVGQGGRIAYDLAWTLVDDGTTDPITITLVNKVTGYAGS